MLLVFRFLATAMLSTRFGYLRPAERARARAALFCFGESDVDLFFGFLRFHGGRDSERSAISSPSRQGNGQSRSDRGVHHYALTRLSSESEPSCFTSWLYTPRMSSVGALTAG